MKRYAHNRKKMLRERSMKGVAARERKRMAESVALTEVGGFVTWGNLGMHDVRLLAYPGGGRLAVVVDGQHKQARTFRGVLRCMAEMIERRMT